MAFVVNERTGEGFVFKGILQLEVRRMGRRVTANLYRGKDIPMEMGSSAYITAAVIPETYVLEQHRRLCSINGHNPDVNVEFTFDIMDSDLSKRFFVGLWSQQPGRKEYHEFVGGFSFAIHEILENDMGGWYYLLPQAVGLRSYAKVTHYALDVLTKEYEQKCWLLLKAGRGIKVSFEKDIPATIKRINRSALEAGLLEGDVILELNRRDVSNCSGDVILDYMWEFINRDIELLISRLIYLDYPEPYQRDHYRVILSNEPSFCGSSPAESERDGSPYDFALDESPFQGRSTRVEQTDKTPGKRAGSKSLGKRITGAMTKISRQLFGKRIRPKSQERGRAKSQERSRYHNSEHVSRSPRKPKRLSRPYSSSRSNSVSRDADRYTEDEEKENVNDHIYVNLDSLISSSPKHLVGRRSRLQSATSVSALHSEEVKTTTFGSSFSRGRPTKSAVLGYSSDGEQLKPVGANSTRNSRRSKAASSGSGLHGEQVKTVDTGSEFRSSCRVKSAASISALNNEEVKTFVAVSNVNCDALNSVAVGSAPKEVTPVGSASNTNGRCLSSMVSGTALSTSRVHALNSLHLKPITSNFESSNTTDSNTRVSSEFHQSRTSASTVNSEHPRSKMASCSTLTNEPPTSTASCSTPIEKHPKSTASRHDPMRTHGLQGLGNSRLPPSLSVRGNYFSQKCLTSNCLSSPDSFTGTGECSPMSRILSLKQRSSSIHLNQSPLGLQDMTYVCPRDQKDSIKPDEPTESIVEQDATFDCTFVSDIIQEDGGEELMSWTSSFAEGSFSSPVCNLGEDK